MLQLQFGPGSMPAASTRAINEETEGATTAATAGAGVAAATTGATVEGVVGVDGTVVGVEVRGRAPAEDGADAGTVMEVRVEAWAGAFPPGVPTVTIAATAARPVTTSADRRRHPPPWIGRNVVPLAP
jgi:hypothetical protein